MTALAAHAVVDIRVAPRSAFVLAGFYGPPPSFDLSPASMREAQAAYSSAFTHDPEGLKRVLDRRALH